MGSIALPETVPETGPEQAEIDGTEDSSDTRAVTDHPIAVTAALTGAGIGGRVMLQHIPSVEPLIAVAVAIGFYNGARHGIAAGATGYYLSNFLVFGGQGPWSLFQLIGGAGAGLIGALAGRHMNNRMAYLGALLGGVLAFELAVNMWTLVPSSLIGGGVTTVLAAAPFILAHGISTIGFGAILYGTRTRIGLDR